MPSFTIRMVLIISFVVQALYAAVGAQWVTVDTFKVFSTSVSIDKARTEVLRICRAAAINEAVPTNFYQASTRHRIRAEDEEKFSDLTVFSDFFTAANRGYILEEKIETEGFSGTQDDKGVIYRMILKALVKPVTGKRNPSIGFEIKARNSLLKSGDELVLVGKSSVDGYIYIFEFFMDGTVILLHPNSISLDNRVFKSKPFQIPSVEEKERGIKYLVQRNPGEEITEETLYVILTTSEIAQFKNIERTDPDNVQHSGGERSYSNFQRWLSEIPLSQRVENAIQIHITSK